jgi:hypothetical protein
MTYDIFGTIDWGWRPRIWLNWRWLNATRTAQEGFLAGPLVADIRTERPPAGLLGALPSMMFSYFRVG